MNRKGNQGRTHAGGTRSTAPAAPVRAAQDAAPDRPAGKQRSTGPLNEVKLDARNPIPFEIGNQAFITMGGLKYIPFFNGNDQFANTLLEARLLSPTQSGCITTKRLYMVGNGVIIRNLTPRQKVAPGMQALMKRANGKRQTLNRVYDRAFESLLTFGNAPMEVVVGSAAGKPFMYIYAKNFLDCRLGAPDENGDVNYALVGKQFRHVGVLTQLDKVKQIPIYRAGRLSDADNWLTDGKVKRTMIWPKHDIAGYDNYGLPSSIASLIYQVIEYGGARFNLDNLENNMVIGNAIFLTGSITQDEADRITSAMIRRHTGHGRRGRTAVFASENGIVDAKSVSMDTHKDGSYKELNETCESKIIFANEWDAILAGLKHTSSLGKGGGYLKEVYEQKLKTVIIPAQNRMIEETWLDIVSIAKTELKEDWSIYDVGFDPIQIDNKTGEASTTVNGLNTFLDIVALVATGAYELAAAIELVMAWYGLSKDEATKRLGTIKVIGPQNVRTKPNGPGGSDNPAGGPPQDGNQ